MGEKTNIAWCDHTLNPWIGCQKVSSGCDHCYAERQNNHRKWNGGTWGPHAPRTRTSDANWKLPLRWAKAVRGTGRRQRVFCASLADVFDNQAPIQWRTDLFDLIAATPELDWLLLTKRPENFDRFMPVGKWPNIWLGTTCEDQDNYDRRWRLLRRQHGVAVRFISYEPAIGPLQFFGDPPYPDWFIAGGETGSGYRDADPNWFRQVKFGCNAHGIPFFMKQMSGRKAIPDDLMLREFPKPRHDW